MSKGLKGKALAAILLEIICILLFGFFLLRMQTSLSVSNQRANTQEKLDSMQETIDAAYTAARQNEVSYDEVYQSKAVSVAYMANHDQNFAYTDAKMKELAGRMNVNNILIIDREGNRIAQAEKTAADFTYQRYNQLRTVFETGEASEAFEVVIDGNVRRYYAAKIDEKQEAVIEQDPAELHALQEDTSSWQSILGKISVGLNGFTFAVSNQDYTFLYYPEEELVGKDALDAGLKAEELSDGNFAWMNVNGREYYCGVKAIPEDDAFVICAVPSEEMTSSANITVAVVLFIFFVVITAVIAYAILLLKERRAGTGRKILTFAGMGFLAILVVSFYMQTLFSLSLRSMSSNRQVQEVGETLAQNEENVELVTAQYNRRYLNKCQTAAYILSGNRELWTKQDLAELSSAIGAEFLIIFDKNGKEVLSDSTYVNFEISTDPEDQSYEFASLLQGREYVIQQAQPDQVSGTYRQYIGTLLTDEEGNADGFVQMGVVPEKLESALQTTELSSVLKGVKASAGGFAFAVDKETQTFAWYPDERLNGKSVLECGMTERQLHDGYCDYLTINYEKYFASSLETDDYYLYVAVPQKRLMASRIPVALASGAAGLLCLLLVYLLMMVGAPKNVIENKEGKKPAGPMVEVLLPDGSKKKSEAAANRWSDSGIRWREKTAEQKLVSLLQILMSVFAVAICAMVLWKDQFFHEGSIFLYIIEGKWERSLNVFALTGCVMIICVGSVLVLLLTAVLKSLSRAMNARGATVCHLLRNLVKYLSVIAMMYYCFALFGVDTQTLLASAGILSLVIGLGAQKLVSDILAGLFIIFEGEFQVGDIVTIGDWCGTVQEIGVRTTKIVDAGENVKIISNSAVSGVVNMTKRNSYCFCELGIAISEEVTLERIEHILTEELPGLKEKLPAILDGPVYNGVYAVSGNNVTIRLRAECNEADKAKLGRDLNREMKLIFDRYGITLNSATHS